MNGIRPRGGSRWGVWWVELILKKSAELFGRFDKFISQGVYSSWVIQRERVINRVGGSRATQSTPTFRLFCVLLPGPENGHQGCYIAFPIARRSALVIGEAKARVLRAGPLGTTAASPLGWAPGGSRWKDECSRIVGEGSGLAHVVGGLGFIWGSI